MKKLLILTLLSLLTYSECLSQENLNKLSINPVKLFAFNIANFEYERGFSDGKYGLSFFYGRTGNTTRTFADITSYISEQSFNFKIYPKTIKNSGLWYGSQLSVASGSFSTDQGLATGIGTLGISGKLGYQLIKAPFYFDIFGGVGLALTNDLFGTATYSGNLSPSSLLLLVGMKTGITF